MDTQVVVRIRRTAAASADGLLTFFIAFAVVTHWFPFRTVSGVVSPTSRVGEDAINNYMQFAVCVCALGCAFAVAYVRERSFIEQVITWLVRSPSPASASGQVRMALAILLTLAVASNAGMSAVDTPFVDAFHEGEYLGSLPNIADVERLVASSFSVHGPGIDLLPGYVASMFAKPGARLIPTRFAYSCLRFLAVLAAVIALLILVSELCSGAEATQRLGAWLLATLVFCIALNVGAWPNELALHKIVNARDTLFLVQLCLALSFASNKPTLIRRALIAVAVGALLPVGVIYCFDRGLYTLALMTICTALFVLAERNWKAWIAGVAIGAALGMAGLGALIGIPGLEAIADQIAFWVVNGRIIWSIRGFATLANDWALLVLVSALLGCAVVIFGLVHDARERGLRDAMRRWLQALVIVSATLVSSRMAIERGDTGHVAWAATSAWLLISAFMASCAVRVFHAERNQNDDPTKALLTVAVAVLLALAIPLLNPVPLVERAVAGLRVLDAPDRRVLADEQLTAVHGMADHLRGAKCFYTLTNESAWYYLLDTPSCSRFYQVTNARTLEAQDIVIRDLKLGQPNYILFRNGGWSNSLDGVSFFNANPKIANYVLEHFSPGPWVEDNWLWERSNGPPQFEAGADTGEVVNPPASTSAHFDLELRGTLLTAERSKAHAIYVTVGRDNRPVWAGPITDLMQSERKWSATVPTAILGRGPHLIRVWVKYRDNSSLVPLASVSSLTIDP